TAVGAPGLGDLRAEFVAPELRIAKFDLTFAFGERRAADGSPDGLDITVEYATDLYGPETITRLLDRMLLLLESAATEPDSRVGAMALLQEDEREQLTAWAGARTAGPELGLDGLFAGQAARSPEATALVFEDQVVSYGELDVWSNRLARHLTSRGVRPGDLVAVHVERSPQMVAALLAVLKAGAGYTMLDPLFPVERLNGVLEQVAPAALLTQSHLATLSTSAVVVDLTAEIAEVSGLSGAAVETGGSPESVACVMFTSGSTGLPKGVMASHRALAATFVGPDYLAFGPEQTFLQCSPVSWDAFALEVFGPLLHGGVCVLQPGQHTDPHLIAELVERHQVTSLQMSASLFNHMLDEHPQTFAHVKEAMTAGEAASPTHTARALADHPELHLLNGYGPAESMGFTTVFVIEPGVAAGAASIPVGGPLAGKHAYVLDANLELVAPGVPGELYVAGHGLAHGYIGQSALTADRFVANPYGPAGARMYRTGDLARWNKQGALEYLGRGDEQIKLRGFRIEPGEIEAALMAHAAVVQAAAVVREDRPGEKRLVAYVVGEAAPEELRRHVAARLPEHLVPSAFVVLDALPRTVNGKLDRRALPAPDDTTASEGGRAPRNPAEEILCGLFADNLGLESVSIDDNFFHRGGHSLRATRLISRIRAVWDTRITISDLFRSPTPALLAEQIAAGSGDDPLGTVLPIRAVTETNSGEPPLFCVHAVSGVSWGYAGLLPHLDQDRPVVALQARRLGGPHDAPSSIEEMADDYLAEIRRIQPHGPYHLLGWSFGGLVAHAVAARLEAAGEDVALLALLDSYPLPDGFRAPEIDGRHVLTALLGSAGEDVEVRCADTTPDIGELADALRRSDPVLGALEHAQAAAVVAATLDNLRMRYRYVPDVRFGGDAVFFDATGTPAPSSGAEAWAPYVTGRVEEFAVDCEHARMTEAEPLRAIGRVLARRLRPARTARI
ncbi:amino acid adenylation domain-containing protein, partial [Streptomyces sp. NPDC058548]|uniref:amino acid adenylation domain-containing protein n=1 Tax=Streptomyces sp. NPDC058548 TaxID=3346545 RepID=UPI0036505A25